MAIEPEPEPEVAPLAEGVSGGRWAQLFALLGLTGFAISQPLLAVAGEDPTLFIVAGVEGWRIVAFALIVAFVPPLALWVVVEVTGRVERRAGAAAFVVIAAALAGTTAIQWTKTVGGIEARWVLAIAGVVGAVGFGAALVRFPAVALWTRFTAVLPPVAVVLLLVASPAGDLLRARSAPPAAEGTAAGGVPASVVFVLLDELPLQTLLADDGSIDAVRYPNLAELAAGSTWYREHTAVANVTLQSVPSILSGTEPNGAAATWMAHPDNLFSLLAPTHDLEVVEPVTRLCGYTTCAVEGATPVELGGIRSLLSRMVEVWSDRVALAPIPAPDIDEFEKVLEPADPEVADVAEPGAGFTGETQVTPVAVADFLGALRTRPSEDPSFAYLHLLLPHQPWRYYPDGRSHEGASAFDLAIEQVEVTDWDLTLLEQAHIFQTMYADRLVGEVIERLRDNGTYDDTLVVVTSDHGIRFDTAELEAMRTADVESLDRVAYVPLFVKSPGQREGRVDDSNLTALDVVPTIAAELGLEVPWEVDGVAAGSPEVTARGQHKTFYDFSGVFGTESLDVVDFESSDHRPSAARRHVGAIEAGEHHLAALLRPLGGDRWLGARVEDLDVSSSVGVATVSDVEWLRRGGRDGQLGRLRGSSDGLDEGAAVLLVVDGVVQSASPVLPDGRLRFLVPPEVVGREDLAVSLLVSDGDGFAEVELRT